MCLNFINKLINKCITMNESISILLATTVLALGGLGLYMFKTSDEDKEKRGDNEYNEEGFLSSSFFGWGSSDDQNKEKEEIEEDEEYYEEPVKPRRRGQKTQRNRKQSTSKRRY